MVMGGIEQENPQGRERLGLDIARAGLRVYRSQRPKGNQFPVIGNGPATVRLASPSRAEPSRADRILLFEIDCEYYATRSTSIRLPCAIPPLCSHSPLFILRASCPRSITTTTLAELCSQPGILCGAASRPV